MGIGCWRIKGWLVQSKHQPTNYLVLVTKGIDQPQRRKERKALSSIILCGLCAFAVALAVA
jgi:hypothetical protein